MEERSLRLARRGSIAYRPDLTNFEREPPMKIKRVEHIAIAVDSLNQSASILRDAFGINKYEEQIGSTRLAMLPVGETYIELLESAAPDSGVSQWIREKGAGLFHLCFEVEDIDGALTELKAKGIKLRDETPRIGHAGARIAFIDPASTGNVLIELAELPSGRLS
jgi:methylmalonyl-CoA/ethylmalonyl-CoA epimerase